MRLQVFLSLLIVWSLSGCASPGGLSAAEVQTLSDLRLCQAVARSPVGFLPLEVERRGLDCSTLDVAMLHELYADQASALIPVAIPERFVRRSECEGVSLGAVVMPVVTTSSGTHLGGLVQSTSRSTDDRFHQYLRNASPQPTYVLTEYTSQQSGRTNQKLVLLQGGQSELVRFGFLSKERFSVSIVGCRRITS